MSSSSDAAEQLVHTYLELYLEGTKIALDVSGKATKNVISALYALSKEQKKTKGQIRLSNMIKTGKELKIFPVSRDDLKKFTQEAKRYGVLYCLVMDKHKKAPDEMIDIMVKAEDASKIDRIVRRFNIQTMSSAEIKSEIAKTKEQNSQKPVDKDVQTKEKEVIEKDEKSKAPIQKEEGQNSPSITKSEKSNQLENSSKNKKNFEEKTIDIEEKPSVREELKEIRADLESKAKTKSQEKTKDTKSVSKTPKNKNTKERVK